MNRFWLHQRLDAMFTSIRNPETQMVVPSRLSPIILASTLFAVTFAVNLQAPLYGAYVAKSGLGATAVTLAFAAYVVGLMPTLVFLGGLSDRVGRRLPLVLALSLAGAATVLLSLFPGWPALVIARMFLGAATGLATTAGTAYMTELLGEARARQAALAVTSSTSLGFGGGALATGLSLMVQGQTFIPISFWAVMLAAPSLAVCCLLLARVDRPRLVPLLRLPVFPEATAIYGVAMGLTWASTGVTIAVIPLLLTQHGLGAWTGFIVFLALFVGFLCQPLARRVSNPTALAVGFCLIPLGFLTLLIGSWIHSITLVLLGTGMTSASSYGFTYLAALSEFSRQAPENRARATAGLFVYAYCGFSLPVIATGILSDRMGILPALMIFLIAQICVLTVVALRYVQAGPNLLRRTT